MYCFTQKKNPESASSRDFLCFVGLLPVKPLANVVTSYTCYNRKNESNYVDHCFTSFLTEEADKLMITFLSENVNNKRKRFLHQQL